MLLFLFTSSILLYLFWLQAGVRVFPNVTVGPVPAGQMTPAQLREGLSAWLEELNPENPEVLGEVTLQDPGTSAAWTWPGEELGLGIDLDQSVDGALSFGRSGTPARALTALLRVSLRGVWLPPVIAVDSEALEVRLESLADEVNITPGNASLDPSTGLVREGRSGRLLNRSGTREALLRAAEAPQEGASVRVQLVIDELPPRGSVERLLALDRHPLSSFVTPFDPAEEGRSWNIALASASLDGTVVEPGEELSFNCTVGWRTVASGYQAAPEIVDNELVPGIGGGVCQVATTLFNAALLADLEVVQRHRHSRPLAYIGLGRDAAVAYPALDLVLCNPSAFPVILTVSASDGRLEARFWGRRVVESSVRLMTEEAARVVSGLVIEPCDSLPPGGRELVREPFDGRVVRLWREVTHSGHLVRRELIAVDHYEPSPGLMRVGRPSSPETTAGAGPAAGTGGETGVREPWPGGR